MYATDAATAATPTHPGDEPAETVPCPLCGQRPVTRHEMIEALQRTLGDCACRQLGLYPLPADLKLSVVIPVYNEKDTLHEIIRRVRAVPVPKEMVLVDDYSTDGTRDLLRELEGEPDLRICYHDRNMGKGAALRTGFQHVSGNIVVIQDADLEYNPQEYLRLIQPIVDGRAEVVYGSRFIGDTHRVLFFWHYVGNRLLTMLSNMFTNLNLTDMETCYKVFRRDVLEKITIKSNRFGFEPEITAKLAKNKCRIYEMPISYSGRDYEEGKKIGWKDGLSALWCIIRFHFFN